MTKSLLFQLVSKEIFEQAVITSTSIKEIIDVLGFIPGKGGYRKIHRLSNHYDIDLPVFDARQIKMGGRVKTKSDERFFVKGSYHNGPSIRVRLIRLGVPYQCSEPACDLKGKTSWAGKSITFQVDHLNGDSFDNRFENLHFLCPICHSQTDTYGSKNGKRYNFCACGRKKADYKEKCSKCSSNYTKIKTKECSCGNMILPTSTTCLKCMERKQKIAWPSVENLTKEVEQLGYLALSKKLGVSDNAIRKHLKAQGERVLPQKIVAEIVPCNICGKTEGKNKNSQTCSECVTFKSWPALNEIIDSVKLIGYNRTAEEIGTHHATLKKHLKNNGVDKILRKV